jgi:hypothetical protein
VDRPAGVKFKPVKLHFFSPDIRFVGGGQAGTLSSTNTPSFGQLAHLIGSQVE